MSESVLSSFIHGFPLDLAFTSYMLIFFLLLDIILPYGWIKPRSISFFTLSFLVIFLSFADRYLYDVWSSKFNQDALHFMQHPKEALASSGHLPFTNVLLATLCISLLLYVAFKKALGNLDLRISWFPKWVSILLMGALAALGARQSFSVAPIGPSAAYYSKNPANNNASLNSAWNFIYQCFQPVEYIDLEKYDFFTTSSYSKISKDYFVKSDSVLTTFKDKPNLVLIVLESFNAYLSNHYSGVLDHTPFLDSLSRSGISFTNCYAGTNRTDKALACINSGFPGTPWNSILNQPEKAVKLPQLSHLFKKKGYYNSFNYGGDLDFANMKSYLNAGSFDQLNDIDHFRRLSKIEESKWGVHDEVVFGELAKENKHEPFFEQILSLSSHEPFDVPYKSEQRNTKYGPFYNSVEYTDHCLKSYFESVSDKDWFNNTVFIFVSDHGRDVGVDADSPTDSVRYKIPILIWGHPLNGMNMKVGEVTSQTDLANTVALLFGLDNNSEYFPFSRNLFTNKEAFFFTNGGWGLMNKDQVFTSFENKYYMNQEANKTNVKMSSDIVKGAAIQYEILNYYKNL